MNQNIKNDDAARRRFSAIRERLDGMENSHPPPHTTAGQGVKVMWQLTISCTQGSFALTIGSFAPDVPLQEPPLLGNIRDGCQTTLKPKQETANTTFLFIVCLLGF